MSDKIWKQFQEKKRILIHNQSNSSIYLQTKKKTDATQYRRFIAKFWNRQGMEKKEHVQIVNAPAVEYQQGEVRKRKKLCNSPRSNMNLLSWNACFYFI